MPEKGNREVSSARAKSLTERKFTNTNPHRGGDSRAYFTRQEKKGGGGFISCSRERGWKKKLKKKGGGCRRRDIALMCQISIDRLGESSRAIRGGEYSGGRGMGRKGRIWRNWSIQKQGSEVTPGPVRDPSSGERDVSRAPSEERSDSRKVGKREHLLRRLKSQHGEINLAIRLRVLPETGNSRGRGEASGPGKDFNQQA